MVILYFMISNYIRQAEDVCHILLDALRAYGSFKHLPVVAVHFSWWLGCKSIIYRHCQPVRAPFMGV